MSIEVLQSREQIAQVRRRLASRGLSRPDELFAEVSRILRPGGYFVFSCDYWPEKIDTSGLSAFGMDWMIFSRADLIGLLGVAERYGLQVSDPVQLEASEAPIRWNGRRYTFAWAVLQKGASSE